MSRPTESKILSNVQLRNLIEANSGLHLNHMDAMLSQYRKLRVDGIEGPDNSDKFTIVWPLTFSEQLGNVHGTLHGGIAAYLVDSITSIHLFLQDGRRSHVSVNLSLNYMRPVPLGCEVAVKTKVASVGGKLAFLEAEFWSADRSTLYLTASHTKMFLKIDSSKTSKL